MPASNPDHFDNASGVFCPHGPRSVRGASSGPLAGRSMGVKDLYDIAGHATSFGNPTWLRTHAPATQTASAVTKLLAAGAGLTGKTVCDELCFSLAGENMHYGTPQNVNAPGRIPGGSSSGSAAAVAGELVDFAPGSDTGGSVRIPASYCGILGIRTSHERIPSDGVLPLAPQFDVVGWFAREPGLFALIGTLLLADYKPALPPTRLLVLDDAFEIAGKPAAEALKPALDDLQAVIGEMKHVSFAPGTLTQWAEDFRHLQGVEIWETHKDWILREEPVFDPAITARLRWTASLGDYDQKPARARQQEWRKRAADLLRPGTVLALPLAPGAAPLRGQSGAEIVDHRRRLIPLLCLSGLAGLPQISLPLAQIDGCPLGLGVIAGKGEDETLLALAAQLADRLAPGS